MKTKERDAGVATIEAREQQQACGVAAHDCTTRQKVDRGAAVVSDSRK